MNRARRTVNTAATPDMICSKQIVRLLLCGLCMVIALSNAAPDSGGHVPLPGPGLSYGGIPYGSVSGNVAEYFKRQAPPGGASAGLAYAADHAEQWL